MMDPAHTNSPGLLRPSCPFTGMSEASTPTTTTTTTTAATEEALTAVSHSYIWMFVAHTHMRQRHHGRHGQHTIREDT